MTKLIYEIAQPFCDYREVSRHAYYNPPQRQWPPPIEYRKRILVEATSEQIEEAEKTDGDD